MFSAPGRERCITSWRKIGEFVDLSNVCFPRALSTRTTGPRDHVTCPMLDRGFIGLGRQHEAPMLANANNIINFFCRH